jgi:hypothetical protein
MSEGRTRGDAGTRARRLVRSCTVVLAVALTLPAGAGARDWPARLSPCGTARCGTYVVPLDRADPTAGTIGLNVMVLPALDEADRAPDAITAIAGGPGAAATAQAAWARVTFLDAAAQRDILLVDQRGTGKSKPLLCPSPGLVVTAARCSTSRSSSGTR